MTTLHTPSEPDSDQRYDRPSWQEYFMEITELVAKRSTCRRRAVGAIIVKDKRILSTGYNGAPAGVRHCIDIGCLREEMGVASGERHELCRGIHAEQNAIIQAALHGVRIADSTLFCTNLPCPAPSVRKWLSMQAFAPYTTGTGMPTPCPGNLWKKRPLTL